MSRCRSVSFNLKNSCPSALEILCFMAKSFFVFIPFSLSRVHISWMLDLLSHSSLALSFSLIISLSLSFCFTAGRFS